MRFVTRERVKVDRVACPWSIRRFVDKDARFFFVPVRDVRAFAEREGAIPFDIDGVEFPMYDALYAYCRTRPSVRR